MKMFSLNIIYTIVSLYFIDDTGSSSFVYRGLRKGFKSLKRRKEIMDFFSKIPIIVEKIK
jgi:hypothetical protein